MGVTVKVKNVEKFVAQFRFGLGARPTIHVSLKITGPAAAYALVWEWGRVDVSPGPKTVWGTNPDGRTTVLTKTAPYGYIRVNKEKFRQIVRAEMKKVRWDTVSPRQIPNMVFWALTKAAPLIADLIAETAPVDTGQLRDAIRALVIIGPGGTQQVVDVVKVRARLKRAS